MELPHREHTRQFSFHRHPLWRFPECAKYLKVTTYKVNAKVNYECSACLKGFAKPAQLLAHYGSNGCLHRELTEDHLLRNALSDSSEQLTQMWAKVKDTPGAIADRLQSFVAGVEKRITVEVREQTKKLLKLPYKGDTLP